MSSFDDFLMMTFKKGQRTRAREQRKDNPRLFKYDTRVPNLKVIMESLIEIFSIAK